VGTCTKPPICKDTEALLDVQYWSGNFYYNQHSFRVEDKDGNTVLHGEPEGRYSLHQLFACLPKDDACYTFLILIGGDYQWDPTISPQPTHSDFFDGKLVRRSDSWLLDSVRFGGSCKPLCNEEDESVIEFFLYDRDRLRGDSRCYEVEYEYEWYLNITNRNSSATVSSGVVPHGPSISPLAHKIMCVPNDSCSSFSISAPNVIVNVTTNEALFLYPVYSLAMDKVTYRKVQWYAPEDNGFGSDNQTTNMGSCTVGGLCDEQTQDLFALELRTLPTPQSQNNQTANSARPSTPADATSRPAAAATPSTKTPDPKKKRGSDDPRIMPTVSTDEFAPTTQGIRKSLYDEDGNLRPEVISMLRNDENYALIKCKGSSRNDRVSAIVHVIAPEFEGNAKEWVNDIDLPSVDSSTVTRDANNLETLLNALTRGKSKRAADAIIRMLNRPECSDIKDAVKNALNVLLNENVQLSIQVVDGIKEAIAHHTNSKGGTRTIDAETFVKNTVLACVWGTVGEGEDVAISRLSEIIGTTDNQVKMARTTARGLIDDDTAIAALERKRRKDFIRDTLLPHLYRWIIDDDVTRFDSNQSHATIVDPEDPSKKIKVHQRIWRLTNREQQHKVFLQSSYYKAFMDMNPSATGVGITVFSEGLKKFKKLVSNPKPESCVDEKVSGLEYAMEAMFGVLNKGETKESFLCHQCKEGEIAPAEVLELMRLRSSHKLVDAVCCEKVERPDLHIDKEKDCPRMIPFSCTHGKFVEEEVKKKGKGKGSTKKKKKKKKKKGNTERCQCCGYKKRLMALFDKVKDDERLGNKAVTVMVWEKARRQGKAKKNGKDNTQQELTSKVMTVAQLIDHFVKLLHICIPHIQEIRWIKHLQDTDFTKMSPGTILIFTDYAALMALRARQAKNSSVDAHAICDNFVILWNKRVVNVL